MIEMQSTVGASLLAIAVYPSISMLDVSPPSRAGSPPQGFVFISGSVSGSERISRHANKPFHQHPRTAAHDGFVHCPFTVHQAGLGTDTQGARRMAETHGIALDAARCEVYQRAGN